MAAIFISHSSKDNAWASRIKAWLEAHGHQSFFLDFDPEAGIQAGQDWEQVIYARLRQCQAVLALVSDHWLASKWCFAEAVQAREKGKQLLIARISGVDKRPLFGDLQHIDFVDDQAKAFERLRIALTDVFALPAGRPPYPGLVAFNEEDAAVFVGRDPETAEAIEVLESLRLKRASGKRLLLVLGASGSGKSSLVRAGVLPRLRRYPDRWLPLRPFQPGENPTREMAFTLASEFARHGEGRDVGSILQGLAPGESTNASGATRAANPPTSPVQAGATLADLAAGLLIAAGQPQATVVLIIDQAEELFSYGDKGRVDWFLRLLRAALETSGGRLIAIATLRSDFLGEFQDHGFLSDPTLLPHRDLVLDPMPVERFEAVIRVPARRAHVPVEFEDELVRKIVSDTGTRDALPLLAFTLQRLWNDSVHREDGVIRVHAYDAFGGLGNVVSQSAQEAFLSGRLEPDKELLLRNTFVPGLVQVNAEGGRTRRRARCRELPHGAMSLLKPFIEARLLVTGVDDEKEETVEVAHEALLRTWPVLTRWIDEDQDKLRWLDGLQRAAQDWHRAEDKNKEDLLVHRDGRLGDIRTMLREERFARVKTKRDEAYLQACERAQERRLRLRDRLLNRLKLASVLLLLLAGVAFWLWHQAQAERNVATRRAAEALALEALTRHSSNEAIAWLRETQPSFQNVKLGLNAVGNGHSWLLWQGTDGREGGIVQWSPEGRLLAYAPHDNAEVRLIDMHDGKIVSIPRAKDDSSSNEYLGVRQMVWSPDGTVLAILQSDESILLWYRGNGGTQTLPGYEQRLGISLDGLAWTAGGDRLLTADAHGRIRSWAVLDGVAKQESLTDVSNSTFFQGVNRMAWSPDASLLALGRTDGTIALWQRIDGTGRELLHARGTIWSLAWSLDGKRLAASTSEGTLLLFEGEHLAQHEEYVAVPEDGPSDAWGVPASPPSQKYLAEAKRYATDLAFAQGPPAGITTLAASRGRIVMDLAWSSNGSALAAATGGGQIWLLDVNARTQSFLGGGSPPLRWSPSGSRLVSQGGGGVVRIWSLGVIKLSGTWVVPTAQMMEFHTGVNSLVSLAWAPDSRALVSSSTLGVVQVWDTQREIGEVIPNLEIERPCAVAWSNEGAFLAVRSFNGSTVSVWRKSDGFVKRFEGLVDETSWDPPVNWSPTAAVLVLPMRDGRVLLYDASSGGVSELDHPEEAVQSVRWSNDGTKLLGASKSMLVIWDVSSKQKRVLASPRELAYMGPYTGDWSPDGKTVVAAQADGTLLFWDSAQDKTWLRREGRAEIGNVYRLDWISERLLVVGFASSIEVWDLQQDIDINVIPSNKPNMFSKHIGLASTYSWSANRRRLATGGGSDARVELFNENFERVQRLNGPGGQRVSALSWSPDGAVLAAGGESESQRGSNGQGAPNADIIVWDVASGQMMTLSGHREQVWAVAWSPEGELLASTAADGSVRLWPFPFRESSYQRFLAGRSNVVIENAKVTVRAFDGLPWRK
jgi:WD40 repeat protein